MSWERLTPVHNRACPRCKLRRISHYTALFKNRGRPPQAINDVWDVLRMKHYIRESRNHLCRNCNLHWYFCGVDEPPLVQKWALYDLARQIVGRGVKITFEGVMT